MSQQRFSTSQFKALMEQLARAWTEQDTETALACFAETAIYMQPPDKQFYRGHSQLRPYFGALKPGTVMIFHNLWFDEVKQVGVGEFSFGMQGSPSADHGVTVVEVQDGRIAFWREYLANGPASFSAFISAEGKTWQWTIENYP
jgi:ketosteroid isomerase-like protein